LLAFKHSARIVTNPVKELRIGADTSFEIIYFAEVEVPDFVSLSCQLSSPQVQSVILQATRIPVTNGVRCDLESLEAFLEHNHERMHASYFISLLLSSPLDTTTTAVVQTAVTALKPLSIIRRPVFAAQELYIIYQARRVNARLEFPMEEIGGDLTD